MGLRKYDTQKFIEKSKEIHGDYYDYSLVEYISFNKKVKIICPLHGEFQQTPLGHFQKKGCKLCGLEKVKSTKEIFIQKSKEIHGEEFDYSLVEYINSYTKVKIICSKHGFFEQTPHGHLHGQKCRECKLDKERLNTSEFIDKAKKKHNNFYDYSLVEYKSAVENVKIICPTHGIFEQRASNHLSGNGCKKCGIEEKKRKSYIQDCKNKFGNKYDYSLIKNYENCNIKVDIICIEHGIFQQTLRQHLKRTGCPYCAGKKMNTDLFIYKSNEIHNNIYDYSLTEYKRASDKVKITCKEHGVFEQMAYVHLQGSGCPICKNSKGEAKITNILTKNNITYKPEYTFDDCKFKIKLPFDFYINEYNLCIEYNGRQHYESIDYFGGEEDFEIRKIRDNIKKEYCINKNINLEIISYEDDIDIKMTEILNKYGK